MTDTLTIEQRSARMASVRHRDTGPELVVRRFLHAKGLRFRLQRRIGETRPDLVFPRSRIALFVHGCMWHRHPDPNCKLARLPKSRLDFWLPKLEGNRARDIRQQASLEKAGWTVLIIWECEVNDPVKLANLAQAIRPDRGPP